MLTMNRRVVLLGATALGAAGALRAIPAAAADRTYHALLIACTAYPNLPPKVSLVGPNHDAVLVRDFLTRSAPVTFKPENVTLLADGLEGAAGSPTHANIVAALKAIADNPDLKRDDFVYLHLSGHGAQQPQLKAGNESDGLDEIFLPADTGKWENREKGVPNALVDDDIGSALDAIRAKGAFVWTIFDCCHSGTATRAAPVGEDAVAERKVEHQDLGIPDAEMVAAEAAEGTRGVGAEQERTTAFSLETPSGGQSIAKGGLVAFYAAQTIETTPEMPLPKGAEDAVKYGLFTYTIFSKLAENPNITYRQLGHAVLQQYAADSRQRPTPLFEGELDARVFGTEKLDTVMQWKLDVKDNAAGIEAGRLHRLTPGTRLAVLPSPTSELVETIGFVEVVTAKNLTSTVKPVAFDGKPALKLSELPANAYVRLAELAIDYKLVVARPAPSEGLDAEVALVNAMLSELEAQTDRRFAMQLVEPGQEADLRFAVLRESVVASSTAGISDTPALFFLPPSGELTASNGARPPLVAIDVADPAKLKEATAANLTTIYRATALSRLAAANDYKPDQVSVEFRIRRMDTDTFEPLVPATVPIVSPGDEVHIKAQNLSTKLVDINILYVGSDYSITHIDAQRLVAGASVEEGLLAFTDSSYGMERMIAVLTEAPPLSEIEDLKFLEQGGVPPATRSAAGESGFWNMLDDIGMAPATRSAMKLGDKGGPKGGVLIFPMETVPRRS